MLAAALNIVMAAIAWRLPEQPKHDARHAPGGLLQWRVLLTAITLFLYAFGYGGITSFAALYADAGDASPRGLYLTTLAIVVLCTRPVTGRLGDVWGYKRVFVPCLVMISAGLLCLAAGGNRFWMVASAVGFGLGFGTAYPAYVGHVLQDVHATRRGAAFGAIIAAFDTGIGTGSISMGYLISHFGFARSFGIAAAIAALALPYFLMVDWLHRQWRVKVSA
jgi:predicted MFS family arabinose efflux permease